MDTVDLEILIRELKEDAAVFAKASLLAEERLALPAYPGQLEAVGFELNRCYNILEKMFERICVGCENHFEKKGDYHEQLIRRVSMDLPGLRAAFLPVEYRERIRDFKGFRHVFRHAYELELQRQRVEALVSLASEISGKLAPWIEAFREGTLPLVTKSDG